MVVGHLTRWLRDEEAAGFESLAASARFLTRCSAVFALFRADSYSYRSSSRRRAACMWWYITVVTRFSS